VFFFVVISLFPYFQKHDYYHYLPAIHRGRWLYIICGIMTIISGFYGGPPILISPESAAGIKAGARTVLSTVVAGLLFCFATFFAPLFQGIPNAGTTSFSVWD
jgi:xanthine/uracil/vitamin C permease (AzgA family)